MFTSLDRAVSGMVPRGPGSSRVLAKGKLRKYDHVFGENTDSIFYGLLSLRTAAADEVR